MKNILLVTAFVLSIDVISLAQSVMKFITLPTLDSTGSSSMVLQAPDSTFLFSTWQSGVTGAGTTFIKTDLAGNPLNVYQFGGENIRTIKLCSDKGYIMLGSALIKTDSAFNIQWAKKISLQHPTLYFNTVLEKDGYSYLVASIINSAIDPSLSFYSTYVSMIFKFDSAGNMVKSCVLADTTYSSSRFNFYFSDAVVSNESNLYFAYSMLQYWAAGTCNREPIIIKLDTALNVKWANQYHVNIFNLVSGIKILRDNNLLLFGDYGNNYPYCTKFRHFVQKIDTAGIVLFAKDYHHSFPASQGTSAAIELEDASLLFSRSFTDTVAGYNVPYFDRTDSAGNMLKSMAFDFPSSPYTYTLSLLNSTNGIIPVSRQNNTDSLLFMTIDTTLFTTCGSRINIMIDSTIIINRDTFVTTYLNYVFAFHDTVFAPLTTLPANSFDVCPITTVKETRIEDDFTIYPNPSRGNFTIKLEENRIIKQIVIYNLYGEQIYSSKINIKSSNQIDLKISSGLYFVKLIAGNNQVIHKLIIEN